MTASLTLAKELGPAQRRVNVVTPGFTTGPLARRPDGGDRRAAPARAPRTTSRRLAADAALRSPRRSRRRRRGRGVPGGRGCPQHHRRRAPGDGGPMTGRHHVRWLFHSTAMVADYDLAVRNLGSLVGLTVLEYGESQRARDRAAGRHGVGRRQRDRDRPADRRGWGGPVRLALRRRHAFGGAPGRGPRGDDGAPRSPRGPHRGAPAARDVLHRSPRHRGRVPAVEHVRARGRPPLRRRSARTGAQRRVLAPATQHAFVGAAGRRPRRVGRAASPRCSAPRSPSSTRRRARRARGGRVAGRLHPRPLPVGRGRETRPCGGGPTSGRAPTCSRCVWRTCEAAADAHWLGAGVAARTEPTPTSSCWTRRPPGRPGRAHRTGCSRATPLEALTGASREPAQAGSRRGSTFEPDQHRPGQQLVVELEQGPLALPGPVTISTASTSRAMKSKCSAMRRGRPRAAGCGRRPRARSSCAGPGRGAPRRGPSPACAAPRRG